VLAFLNLIHVQACLHVSGGYGSAFLNKARQVEACSFSEIEFPLVLGRDFSGRVVAKGLGVGHDVNIGDEVWGALPPHLQGCHAQFVRVNKTLVSEFADVLLCLTIIFRNKECRYHYTVKPLFIIFVGGLKNKQWIRENYRCGSHS
jgi:hypothetical protein